MQRQKPRSILVMTQGRRYITARVEYVLQTQQWKVGTENEEEKFEEEEAKKREGQMVSLFYSAGSMSLSVVTTNANDRITKEAKFYQHCKVSF